MGNKREVEFLEWMRAMSAVMWWCGLLLIVCVSGALLSGAAGFFLALGGSSSLWGFVSYWIATRDLRALRRPRERTAEEAACWQLVEQLAGNEGETVEIVHPNAAFEGPGFMVMWRWGFEERESASFAGDSYLECLQAAVAHREGLRCGQ